MNMGDKQEKKKKKIINNIKEKYIKELFDHYSDVNEVQKKDLKFKKMFIIHINIYIYIYTYIFI